MAVSLNCYLPKKATGEFLHTHNSQPYQNNTQIVGGTLTEQAL